VVFICQARKQGSKEARKQGTKEVFGGGADTAKNEFVYV